MTDLRNKLFTENWLLSLLKLYRRCQHVTTRTEEHRAGQLLLSLLSLENAWNFPQQSYRLWLSITIVFGSLFFYYLLFTCILNHLVDNLWTRISPLLQLWSEMCATRMLSVLHARLIMTFTQGWNKAPPIILVLIILPHWSTWLTSPLITGLIWRVQHWTRSQCNAKDMKVSKPEFIIVHRLLLIIISQ